MCPSGVEAGVLHRRPPDVSATIAGSEEKMSQIFNCSLLVPFIPHRPPKYPSVFLQETTSAISITFKVPLP